MTKTTKWSIDPAHSEIAFKVKHLMIAHVKGAFKIFEAAIYTTGKDFTTAEIDLWIDASSIDTGNKERDEHLKGPDFLDVTKHKQINFRSSTIGKEVTKEGSHELWGELSMVGITKNIKLDVQFGGVMFDPWGNEKGGFTVSGKINRTEWGLVWNTVMEAGGILVGEEISILCEFELINAGIKDQIMDVEKLGANKAIL